ncbi:MAG: choice-of-anchor J domain-containing protein [Bacteroidota bacterium]
MKNTQFVIIIILIFFADGVLAQNANKNIVLEEGFENGMPATWNYYEYGNPGSYEWRIEGYAYTGFKSLFHRASIVVSPDSWMVTPQISVVSTDFYLSFWEAIHAFENYYLHEVLVSTGSGDPGDGDFTDVIYTIPDDNYQYYSEVVLALDEYAGEDIYIAFRYQSPNGQWGDQWHVDDVMLVETNLQHDMACVKMSPVYHASLETPCNPQVIVKNFGYSTESAYSVNLTIEGTTYNETIEVNEDLSALEENIIVFPDWIPEESGTYTLNAIVILPADLNPDNDGFSIDCVTFSPDDYSSEMVYSMEYAPTKDAVDKSITLNVETGEKVYMADHNFVYPFRLAALTWWEGKIIAVQRDICDVFVMTPSGEFILIGNIPNVFYMNGLAYDELSGTLYGVGLEDDAIEDYLYTIDEHWHVTEVMPFYQKMFLYGLAINSKGELYAIETMEGGLFKIDPDAQQTEDIGIIEGLQMAMQIQDIGFDRVNDVLYGTLAVSEGQIFTKISTEDASLDILGNYGFDSPFGACAPIPGIPTSIASHKVEDIISIYPNPSNGLFYISTINTENKQARIDIINVAGQTVYSEQISPDLYTSFKFDISEQENGIYILRYFADNQYHFYKIIKQ